MEGAQEEEKQEKESNPSVYESAHSTQDPDDIDPPQGGVLMRYSHSHPRVCSCCFGVILPVWGLIFLAFFFGYFLSLLEQDSEIESNDDTLAAFHFLSLTTSAFANVTARAPLVCLGLYLQNQTTNLPSYEQFAEVLFQDQDGFDDFVATSTSGAQSEAYRAAQVQSQVDAYTSSDALIVGTDNTLEVADFAKFLFECTEQANEVNKAFYTRLLKASGTVLATGLSFNWNRCVPKEGDDDFGDERDGAILDGELIGDVRFDDNFRFEEQRDHYAFVWRADWTRLFAKYLIEEQERTAPPTGAYNSSILEYLNARLRADLRATQDATGKQACEVHPESAAWFWFTVMTSKCLILNN